MDGRKWSDDRFDALITNLISHAGWFPVHRALVEQVGMEAACILHYLINYYSRIRGSISSKADEGWFFCTAQKMEQELSITGKMQTRLLNHLADEDCPLIRFRRMKMPARRYVQINTELVAQIIADWDKKNPGGARKGSTGDARKGSTGDARNGATGDARNGATGGARKGSIYSKKKQSKKKTAEQRGRKRPRPAGLICDEWDEQAGGHLREALVLLDSDLMHGTKGKNPVSIQSLAKSICRIRTERKVEKSEIKTIIVWLKAHGNDQYVPRIRRSDDLFLKWTAIRDAKLNWDREHESGNGAHVRSGVDIDELRSRYFNKHGPGAVLQSRVDAILVSMGLEPGTVDRGIL